MDDLLTWMIIGVIVCGIIGAFLGGTVNKVGAGFWLGLLLGPIGWIIVFLLPREDAESQPTNGAVERSKTVNIESPCERDLSFDQYKIFLVKKYSIEKNEALDKIICNERLFATIDEALAYADSIEQVELERKAEAERESDQSLSTGVARSLSDQDVILRRFFIIIAVALCILLLISVLIANYPE